MVLCLKARESRSLPSLPNAKEPLPDRHSRQAHGFDAGWSSPVARQAHNLKVVGSNPAPATNLRNPALKAGFFVLKSLPAPQRINSTLSFQPFVIWKFVLPLSFVPLDFVIPSSSLPAPCAEEY